MTVLQKIWQGWQRIGGFIGDFMGRLILTLLYFTLVLPFGLIFRLFRDPLSLQRSGPPSWHAHQPEDPNIDAARKLA